MAKKRLTPSELWSLYPTPKAININEIVTTEERYRKIDAEEQAQRRRLGRHGARIGLNLAVLVIMAISAGSIIVTLMTSIQPSDIGGAMFAVFTSFACAIATVLVGFLIYKKVDTLFTKHLFNGLPVIVILVIINSVVAWIALTLTGHSITGFSRFVVGMALTLVAAIAIAVPLVAICASQVSANTKVRVLLSTVIGLLAIGFVATALY